MLSKRNGLYEKVHANLLSRNNNLTSNWAAFRSHQHHVQKNTPPPEYVSDLYKEMFSSPFIMKFRRGGTMVAKHPRPMMAHCIIEEEKRRFDVALYLGVREILPALKEEHDLERFPRLPVNRSSTSLGDVKADYSMVD